MKRRDNKRRRLSSRVGLATKANDKQNSKFVCCLAGLRSEVREIRSYGTLRLLFTLFRAAPPSEATEQIILGAIPDMTDIVSNDLESFSVSLSKKAGQATMNPSFACMCEMCSSDHLVYHDIAMRRGRGGDANSRLSCKGTVDDCRMCIVKDHFCNECET